jgi:GWxTD domain-containing protein
MNGCTILKRLMALIVFMASGFGLSDLYGWPLTAQGDLPFQIDGAAFPSDSGTVWQEIYWNLPLRGVSERLNGGQNVVDIKTQIVLKDSTGQLVINEEWPSTMNIPNRQEVERRDLAIMDIIAANKVKPGEYNLFFKITDQISGKYGLWEGNITVPRFEPLKINVSQVEIASDIYKDTLSNKFSKGYLQVRPHPSREFGGAYGILYYYYEIERPVSDTAGGNARKSVVVLFNTNSSVQYLLSESDIAGKTGRIIQTGGIPLDSFPDGLYILKVQVRDVNSVVLAYSQAAFKIDHKNDGSAKDANAKNIAEINALIREGGEYFSFIKYITTAKEYAQLLKLDENTKNEFLRRFWKSRDPDPGTPENEALREHYKRCKTADEKFGEKNRKGLQGSETDRGRIYIKYGPPSEIESYSMQIQYKPLEIWRYYNGNKYIFVDKSGFGRFQLVYTNSKDERTDPNYIKYISPDIRDKENIE